MDVGTVVNNVGTAMAVADAVTQGRPLVERVVTVTGDGVKEPKNLLMRIGSTFKTAVEFCGGLDEKASEVYMGGPMMGFAQYDLAVPVIKATSGIVCSIKSPVLGARIYPCIQCGNCVTACPMNLLPTRLAGFAEKAMWEEADHLGVLNCIECGSCAFVCPSHIPLVQWIRVGKLKVSEMKRKNVA
jgi:electron transport complex protein RnfC